MVTTRGRAQQADDGSWGYPLRLEAVFTLDQVAEALAAHEGRPRARISTAALSQALQAWARATLAGAPPTPSRDHVQGWRAALLAYGTFPSEAGTSSE
ncbi:MULTISPECIES: hypothetical protein [Actinosynnema]|uniref:hypothetical protein n=1 Tax=Actinosynnema TaxID=40566 RepID=UPI0020A61A39|nr:hypothetical protein [Actinosynnema pretiosum]MCP2097390.1 hypothetical protein [Actinosynnema pretiosum]